MRPAVVLAAGASRRMASPKYALLLPGGETFVGRIASTLRSAGCDPVIVVVRAGTERAVFDALAGMAECTTLVTNPDPDRGQFSSIQIGVRACDPAVEPVLLTLVDLPLVSVETVRDLYAAWHRTPAPLVRPARAHEHGHPILLGRSAVEALRTASPDSNAREVLGRFRDTAVNVAVNDEGAFDDIDTPAAYDRALRRIGANAVTGARGSEGPAST